jgi:hypothetical protein
MPFKDKERRKEYMKEYSKRPEVKERRIEYYNRPEIKQRKKEYNQLPEVKERNREYSKRPEVKERHKEYNKRPEVKERNKEQKKRRYHNFEKSFFTNNLKNQKKRATKKFPDRIFNITVEYLQEIFPKNKKCPVFNIELKVNSYGPAHHSPSLDRIDNDKGYEIGNVIWVCQKVNQIKTTATPDEIIKVGEFYKKLLEERSSE